MKNWIFIGILLAILGCSKHPLGKDYIYTAKDDHLSLQGKVDLLNTSALLEDDALLSSIAILYAQNKNWMEAKLSISKAIKLNPLNASYHLYLANYNAELTNKLEAYQEAKVAYELGAYNTKLENLIAKMAIETADTINAEKFVLKYYQANKNVLEAQLLMARLNLMFKKYSKAAYFANQVLAKDSLNIEGLQVAYQTYLQIDSAKLAIEFGNKLIAVDSTNALYYFQVAQLYNSIKQVNKSASYYAQSYYYQQSVEALQLALRNYAQLTMYDSVLFYSDSIFAGINYNNNLVLLTRARAYDKRYKFDKSYQVYTSLIKIDSTDSVVIAEQQTVQRKIAYLHRKKREQKQLEDSLANKIQ